MKGEWRWVVLTCLTLLAMPAILAVVVAFATTYYAIAGSALDLMVSTEVDTYPSRGAAINLAARSLGFPSVWGWLAFVAFLAQVAWMLARRDRT